MNMTAVSSPSIPTQRLDDLAEIIRAYNAVTDNLQRSHESLRNEVVRLQRELASTDAQLQRSKRLAALGEMAAGIAHEVRNPLAAIGLYADMIAQDLRPILESAASKATTLRGTIEVAEKIASAVRGLDGIVSDVLTFAREIRPRCQCLSVNQLFVRVIESHLPVMDEAEVRIVCDVADGITMEGDADLLHQALLNVVRNAVEAMPEGGTLTLAARQEDEQVVLIVRDTGPGVDAADIDRIFNPFFTTRHTGTGLGLAIVHRIVDAHGGAITARNEGGAVFELIVPRQSDADDAAESGSGGTDRGGVER